MIILAEAPAPSATTVMNVIVYIVVALASLATVGLYLQGRKSKTEKRQIVNQPVEISKAPKRYNHDLAEERYDEVTRRLDKHDEEIKEIQVGRNKALRSINRRFERVLIGLTVIATKLNTRIPEEEGSEEDEEI